MFRDFPTAMFMTPTVMLIITPDDLRYIASRLEETWLKSKDTIGANLTGWSIMGDKIVINFVIDQERMKK